MTTLLQASNSAVATSEYLPRTGHCTAHVMSVDEDGATVEIEITGVRQTASVAVGCLVRPMPQDLVLVFSEAGQSFVLTVLERTGANWSVVALPGRGNMSIEGETVAIAVRQRMSLRADTIDLQAKLFAVLADKATWIGKLYTLVADRFRSSARIQESSADQLTVKAVERITVIDRVDSLQTETQATRITGIATETAHSKVITVTEDLRIDGKRVTVA
ncbi:DUF3540 domain-containing protein [Microbacteriaceae bacterium K1510]|nr:DUF3540 domain-containing protein [Microbacteriaceae bacterium K1510]